jgi:hypothetical protein
MKLLAGIAVLAFAGTASAPAQAATEEGPGNFKALATYHLACEQMVGRNNNPNDRAQVWFEVVPSEDLVKMTNEKHETFMFPIIHRHTTLSNARNQFGNAVTASFPIWIWFQDKGGKWRQLKDAGSYGYGQSYYYMPGGPNNQGPADNWAAYKCIITD